MCPRRLRRGARSRPSSGNTARSCSKGLAFNFYVFACAAARGADRRPRRGAPARATAPHPCAGGRHAPCRDLPQRARLRDGGLGPFRAAAPDRRSLIGRRLEFPPFLSAVIALGLVYSGYFAETFRAGIQPIPKGQIEAGRACGMSERLILWRIILPQVVRRMLPEAINNFVSLFKATTIVSLIAVPDLMYQVSMVTQQEMQPAAALHRARRSSTSSSSSSSPASPARLRRALAASDDGLRADGQLGAAGLEPAPRATRRARRHGRDLPLSPSPAAIVGGLVLCLVRLYVRPLRPVAIALIEFFRATPIFVQLLWVNYVWPELFGWPKSLLHRRLGRAGAAIERLSRRDLSGRHRGRAAGAARGRHFRRHVAPRSSSRRIVHAAGTPQGPRPAIVNQFTVIVKSSTLVSVITVQDLMFQSQKIVNI